MKFFFRFCSDSELETGHVDAARASDAVRAILVVDAGDGPRWRRYQISENILAKIPDSELIEISSFSEKYSITLMRVGTKKRKPAYINDA